MPRYFFHLQGTRPYQDDGGADLPNDAAAWAEAKRFARDIESTLEPGETWYLEVHRENRPIYSLKICASSIDPDVRSGASQLSLHGPVRPLQSPSPASCRRDLASIFPFGQPPPFRGRFSGASLQPLQAWRRLPRAEHGGLLAEGQSG